MNSTIKKILVTGNNGTIGTRLCEQLLESKDYEVIGIDWKRNKWNKAVDAITIEGDLRSRENFQKLPADIDLVVHLAANARVYNLVLEPELAKDNFETTFNTLEFARKNKVKRFIFASSRETYGNSKAIIHSEKDVRIENCESPYTASKIGGEVLAHSFQRCYGIDFVIIRFSNVYGMYDDSDRVIPLFIKSTIENKDLIIFGKEKLLDFTYIDDAVAGILKIISNFDNVKNDTYNLSTGKGISILEVGKIIQELLGSQNKIIVKENRIGEVVKFIADISKAKQKFNHSPQTDVKEGIAKAIKWYQDNCLRD